MNTPTVLLCVDLQPVFIRMMNDSESLVNRASLAIAVAHGLHLPILFSEQVPSKLGATSPELLALAPDAKAFSKDTFSAFGNEPISDEIASYSPKRIILCGLETSVCVYQTALAALRANYQVTVLSDAISARRPEDADHCLTALRDQSAEVLSVESVFYAMLDSVQHPFFKAYTQLVKAHG